MYNIAWDTHNITLEHARYANLEFFIKKCVKFKAENM